MPKTQYSLMNLHLVNKRLYLYNRCPNTKEFTMNFKDIEIPSNRKFGFFFSVVFGVASYFFYASDAVNLAVVLVVLALLFLVVSVVRPQILLPFNKLWMGLGLVLGMIISPIVLGAIFYGMFMPTAVIMRIFGRDELRLKRKNNISFWKVREPIDPLLESFKNQF